MEIENIKSSFVLKEIFNFLNIKRKLKIIIYNKQLQEKGGIVIEDYKKISGKCRIGKRAGKGIEYIIDTNILIFEGEYLNGKRNGKGIEYFKNGKIKFRGEYLNGKRSGKGQDYYYYNGRLKFEGEYINGKRNGKGKEYDYNGRLKFEGEYLNGLRNGKGI